MQKSGPSQYFFPGVLDLIVYIITSDNGGDFETSGLITLHNLCVLQPVFIYINSNLANKSLKTQTRACEGLSYLARYLFSISP